jgi:UPF0755 protein
MKRGLIAIIALFIFFLIAFFVFTGQVTTSHGNSTMLQTFEVKQGEGIQEIGKSLEQANLIRNDYYFDYYVWKSNSKGKIQAGTYELNGAMTIPEIVQVLSIGKIIENVAKVTFPEGSSIQEMADILRAKGLNGENFLKAAKSGSNLKTSYDFLRDKPNNATLEGFLFPDTYIFKKDANAENIIDIMLQNFDEKLSPDMQGKIEAEGRNIYQIVTMASILEKEAKTSEDMKIASGIFWKRVDVGGLLQSCATIAYVLGKDKKQYSFDDTRTPSPYNTYLNKGLPPGPINNPGLKSIQAAIYPTATDYNYFLTDPNTGEMLYAETLEEHEVNKQKCGL